MRSIEQRGCARRHRTARRPERRGIEGVGASSSRVRVELALPLSHLSPSSSTSSWLMRARGREARCGCASTRGSQKRRVRRLTRSTRSQHGGVRAHERRQWTRRSTRSSSMAWPSCPPLPDRSPRPDAIRWPARSTSGTRSSERARGERAQPSARGGGLEPPMAGPEPAVLPITPPPKGRAELTRRVLGSGPRGSRGEHGCVVAWPRARRVRATRTAGVRHDCR